jgi:DNA modification methylase
MREYKSHFDVVFFSPPYYRLEMYPGKKQSTVRYKTYDEWLQGYWDKTIQLCWHVLQPGGRLCYIVSNYQEAENPQLTLVRDMIQVTKNRGFTKRGVIRPMWNKTVAVNVDPGDNHENICLFVKSSK